MRKRIILTGVIITLLSGGAAAQPAWNVPDPDTLPDDAFGRTVRHGRDLIVKTSSLDRPRCARPGQALWRQRSRLSVLPPDRRNPALRPATSRHLGRLPALHRARERGSHDGGSHQRLHGAQHERQGAAHRRARDEGNAHLHQVHQFRRTGWQVTRRPRCAAAAIARKRRRPEPRPPGLRRDLCGLPRRKRPGAAAKSRGGRQTGRRYRFPPLWGPDSLTMAPEWTARSPLPSLSMPTCPSGPPLKLQRFPSPMRST